MAYLEFVAIEGLIEVHSGIQYSSSAVQSNRQSREQSERVSLSEVIWKKKRCHVENVEIGYRLDVLYNDGGREMREQPQCPTIRNKVVLTTIWLRFFRNERFSQSFYF